VSTPAIALTVAGSDSGGGAGIQADLKTFHRHGVFGTSVVTAITAQNTLGVTAWEPVSLPLIAAQLDAVGTDLRPAALKTGMLGERAVVETVVEGLVRHALGPVVVDPVMVSANGDVLLRPDAVDAVRTLLLPRASLCTPNAHEAGLLWGHPVRTEADLTAAARWLVEEAGAQAALVKGGHLQEGNTVVDVLFTAGRAQVFRHPRLDTRNTHGLGCTLSAAITAHLANGTPLVDAVENALDFVARALATAPLLGRGHGPLNHHA
jgi:hydroxymethylpyrimidine/phosphomethylpyrimidine kinase